LALSGERGRGLHALVDAEDRARLTEFRWHLRPDGYVATTLGRFGHPKGYLLHRVVLGLIGGDTRMADHVNGDKLDNRRGNLRVATPSENGQNRHAIEGASRFRGVTKHALADRWSARATLNGQNHYLGLFKSEEEAAIAAAAFRRKHMPYSADARAA
jgi:hypothetical protein